MARKIAVTEGMFVGYTSGAAMQGAYQYQQQGLFDDNSYVVVIFPDHGSRYMSKIYSDAWMKEQGFLEEQEKNVNNKIKELSNTKYKFILLKVDKIKCR